MEDKESLEALFDTALCEKGPVTKAHHYRKILDASPSVTSLINLGNIQMHLERYCEALEAYDEGVTLRPDAVRIRGNKATALLLSPAEDAEICLNRALALSSDSADLYMKKADVLLMLERFPEGLARNKEALSLNPDNIEIMTALEDALVQAGKFKEALETGEEILDCDRKNLTAWYTRGHCLANLSRYQASISYFTAILALDPDDAGVMYNKGMPYRHLEQYDAALVCTGAVL